MNELAYLEKVLMERGFDPGAYRKSFLLRHVEARARSLGLKDPQRYPFYLRNHAEEFKRLLDSLSINVTSFFRDHKTFEAFEEIVIPSLMENKRERSLRIWSAGCASGQEAYSIAMLLWRGLGKNRVLWQVRIFGTDLNEQALLKARKGAYTARETEGVNPNLLEQFFEPGGEHYIIRPSLRKWVYFLKHDLLKGRLFPSIDVVFCRNVFIYLEKEAQLKLARRFAESLLPEGYLVVGGSEMLHGETARLFKPVSVPGRVYQKIRAGQGCDGSSQNRPRGSHRW